MNWKFEKPKCGVVIFKAERLYNMKLQTRALEAELKAGVDAKEKKILGELSKHFETIPVSICSVEKEKIDEAIRTFIAKKADFIVCFYLLWCEDLAWMKLLRDSPPDIPMLFYLQTFKHTQREALSPEAFAKFTTNTNLVGSLEASGSIPRMNRKVRVVAGRIDDQRTIERIKAFGLAAKARSVLRNAKFGLLRGFNEVMWSTFVDPYKFFAQIGPEIKCISFDEYQTFLDKVSGKDAEAYARELEKSRKTFESIDRGKFLESARASIALARMAEALELDALAVNDVDVALHRRFGLRPGFTHPYFNETLSVLVPEGDIGQATLHLALKTMTRKSVCFIEPFTVDEGRNTILAGHGGPYDCDPKFKNNMMIATDARYEYNSMKHAGAAFGWYKIPEGPMTISHLSECGDGYKLIMVKMESLPGGHSLKGYSHTTFKPGKPAGKLAEEILEIGATQHFAAVEGDRTLELAELAFILGAKVFDLQ